MFVQDLMTPDPVSVRAQTPVKAALRLLDEHNVTALPVVTPEGRLAGVVSEADLIRDLVDRDPRLQAIRTGTDHHPPRPRYVGDVMTDEPITVGPRDDVAVAVELAVARRIKSLPVVDDEGRLVGIVSRRDVVRVLAREDDLIEAEIEGLLVAAGVPDWQVEVREGVAEIDGPDTTKDRALARAIAGAVPGVVDVRVD